MRLSFVAVTALVGIAAAAGGALSQSQVTLAGKTITVVVSSAAGGGNDAVARLLARFLPKHLPGEPAFVVQNMPGANETIALNHMVQRGQADGTTLLVSSSTPVDPIVFRSQANIAYDPKSFRMVGGIGRGGTIIFIRMDADERLHDKSARPVVIGNAGAIPRTAMMPALWAIEFLGWNARWVAGYPGTNDVMLAFDRGEVDITSTGNIFQIEDRLKSGKLKIVNQSGALVNGKLVGRSDYGGAPLFSDQMRGRISDAVARRAFDYWLALNNLDKWVALPPNVPGAVVETYREAFRRLSLEQEFLEQGDKISPGFVPTSAADTEHSIMTLSETPPEALDYIKGLMRKQGLRVP